MKTGEHTLNTYLKEIILENITKNNSFHLNWQEQSEHIQMNIHFENQTTVELNSLFEITHQLLIIIGKHDIGKTQLFGVIRNPSVNLELPIPLSITIHEMDFILHWICAKQPTILDYIKQMKGELVAQLNDHLIYLNHHSLVIKNHHHQFIQLNLQKIPTSWVDLSFEIFYQAISVSSFERKLFDGKQLMMNALRHSQLRNDYDAAILSDLLIEANGLHSIKEWLSFLETERLKINQLPTDVQSLFKKTPTIINPLLYEFFYTFQDYFFLNQKALA